MDDVVVHPLRAWRLEQGYTLDAAAAGVGTVRSTWCDWESGRRIPDRSTMPKVFAFTRGAVTPNDFYDLPDLAHAQPELPIPDAAEPELQLDVAA
jgi:transcriptional regulator with XRE-family HTH domain